jgi:hypothetical protein
MRHKIKEVTMDLRDLMPGMTVRVRAGHPLAGLFGTVVRVKPTHVWVLLSNGHQTPLLISEIELVDDPQLALA